MYAFSGILKGLRLAWFCAHSNQGFLNSFDAVCVCFYHSVQYESFIQSIQGYEQDQIKV